MEENDEKDKNVYAGSRLHWAGKAVLDGGELEKSNGKYLLPLEEKQVCIELF